MIITDEKKCQVSHLVNKVIIAIGRRAEIYVQVNLRSV